MKRCWIKKVFSLILVCVLAVCTLAGCKGSASGGGDGEDGDGAAAKGGKAKGRYVEKEVGPPLAEGEEGVGMFRKKDGGYRIYTYLSGEKMYQAYDSADGANFTAGNADWLNRAIGGKECYLKSVFQGEDGRDYALYYKDEANHLIGTADGSAAEEVFAEVLRDKSSVDMAGVLENGSLVTSDTLRGKLEVWPAQGKSSLLEMEQGSTETSGLKTFACRDKRAVVLSRKGGGFSIFNLDTGIEEQTFEYKDLGGDMYGLLGLGEQGDCFYLDRKGLHHVGKNGSTVETLVEGDTVSMGDSSMEIVDFAIGGQEDYFVLYNMDGKASLMHYVYDKEAKVTPDEQLVIFGLEENKTVKQAVSRFQKAHPEIRIRYKTGSQQETGTTRADQIRVLNTELLGGNGADILVIDGLPLESYIEKGVLMDLSEFYKGIAQESPVVDSVLKSMKKEKGLYQLPVRAKVLGMYGTKEEMDALQSLDSLSAYLEKGGGRELLSAHAYEYYIRLLLTLNYKELFAQGEKSAVPEKELKKLLDTARKLGQAAGAETDTIKNYYLKNMPDLTEESLIKEMGGTEFLSSVDSNNDLNARKGRQAVVKEAGGVYSLIEACGVLSELKALPQGVHGLYLPKGMVGVNNSSNKKELAQEFLKLLFSEEIQSLDLNDGFPVNEKALSAWSQREATEDGAGIAIAAGDDDEGMFSASEPSGEQLAPFIQLLKEADTPVLIDDVILEVMVDEGIAYCNGEKSLEDAASNILSKSKTYLAE